MAASYSGVIQIAMAGLAIDTITRLPVHTAAVSQRSNLFKELPEAPLHIYHRPSRHHTLQFTAVLFRKNKCAFAQHRPRTP
uniref:Uncharacterized protein n=1 Tax=Anguilla anguilla TaxID=7936 RepID=A0A0E9U5P1_ANGAN